MSGSLLGCIRVQKQSKWKIILLLKLTAESIISSATSVKNLKIQTPEKFAVIILKVEQFGFMTE